MGRNGNLEEGGGGGGFFRAVLALKKYSMSLNIGTSPSVHPEKSRNIWLGGGGG